MHIHAMKKLRAEALDRADKLIAAADLAGRKLTPEEARVVDFSLEQSKELGLQITKAEKINTIRGMVNEDGAILFDRKPGAALQGARTNQGPQSFSEEYLTDFYGWLSSRGTRISAALYEGAGSAGGYTVPVIVDGQIIPLAPSEMGVRAISTVLPTASDIKIPQQASFGTAAGKAESGASDNFFSESDPTLSQITLSAFMAGISHVVSWELVQDVPTFQQFALRDLVLALQMFEENLFVSGTGTGQAQGLLGNVGAGVTGVTVGSDNYASELLDATFDCLAKLNAAYFNSGTRWLMARSTAVSIRKAQMMSNLFAPVFVTEGGRDYLHGIEVAYSSSMPAIGAGNTPVLFGDFKSGYIIGDRGGSGIAVKILDQPKATEGQVILLAYRRMDARVRRSEAIQGITLHT